jgi:phosphatidylglycerol:prolipoprotein diacylglycerol transferase
MIDLLPSRQVAIELFGFSVHWYGLLYFAGFVTAWFLLPRLQRYRNLSLSADEWSSLLSWAVVGVIVGGRLGYVLFYGGDYYLRNPLEIFAVWKGGMASHGGMIGVTLAVLWALRHRKSDLLSVADVLVVPVAIGLAFGRLGNFINLEIYGIPTMLPWGISIPGIEGLRHPTQIYAIIKNLFIAAVCFWHLKTYMKPGQTLALFFMLYGVLRFIVEFFRDQTGVAMFGPLSEGQILTIPVFAVGAWLWVKKLRIKN